MSAGKGIFEEGGDFPEILSHALDRVERLQRAVEILFEAHRIVVFDTDEDRARQAEILDAVEQIVGYRPGSPTALTDGDGGEP